MSKFHVGDRWADGDGCQWLIFESGDRCATAGDETGRVRTFEHGTGCADYLGVSPLTRIISSERCVSPWRSLKDDPPTEYPVVVCNPRRNAADTLLFPVPTEMLERGWTLWTELPK